MSFIADEAQMSVSCYSLHTTLLVYMRAGRVHRCDNWHGTRHINNGWSVLLSSLCCLLSLLLRALCFVCESKCHSIGWLCVWTSVTSRILQTRDVQILKLLSCVSRWILTKDPRPQRYATTSTNEVTGNTCYAVRWWYAKHSILVTWQNNGQSWSCNISLQQHPSSS